VTGKDFAVMWATLLWVPALMAALATIMVLLLLWLWLWALPIIGAGLFVASYLVLVDRR
jgi:hypothetical protein